MNQKTKTFLKSLLVVLLFSASLAAVAVWTDPLATAPNQNVAMPVTVGSYGQYKPAALVVDALRSTGLVIADNNVQVGGSIDVVGGIKVGNAVDARSGSPSPSAVLEVASTTQGFLPPRMTMIQRDAIRTPATGLIIYQTNNLPGIYYFDGTAWVQLSGSKGASLP